MKLVIFIMIASIFQCSLLYDGEQLEDFPNSIFKQKITKKKKQIKNRKLVEDHNQKKLQETSSTMHSNDDKIAMTFNLQQIETIGKDLKCNENALKAFGLIDDTENVQPTAAEGSMRKYCRKNRFTCCKTSHLEKASKDFTEFKTELQRSFTIVEQMLYVFRGPKIYEFLSYINDTNLKHKCQNIILNDFYYGELNQFEDFLNKTLQVQLGKIEQLLEDTVLYVKKIIWFYSNLYCSVCSPFLSQEFQMNASGATINVNNSTCQEIVDLHEYEYRLVIIYESFVKQIINLIDCVHEQENEKSLKEELGIDDIDLQVAQMVASKEDFYECFQNFVPTEPNCLEICSKQKITHYEFPVKIFEIFKKANKILFTYFVNEDLDEYYQKVMGYDINKCCSDQPIPVLKETESYKIFKMESAELKFENMEGIRIFQEQMGKSFQHYQSKSIEILNMTLIVLIGNLLY